MWICLTGNKKHTTGLRVARNDDEARPLWESRQPCPYRVVALLWFLVNPCSVRDDNGNRDHTRYTIEASGGVIPHAAQLHDRGILFGLIQSVARHKDFAMEIVVP